MYLFIRFKKLPVECSRVRIMAYINVESWSSDQVTDWLKGEQYEHNKQWTIFASKCEICIDFFF